MQVRYHTRANGDRHTSVYDPVTGKGSQFNGHIPGGVVPHKMASVRKLMDANNSHMEQKLLAGPKKPTLTVV